MAASVVDLHLPVSGHTLSWDHSYALFGALSRLQPLFHQPDHPVGIFPINGTAAGNRTLTLTERSTLRLRLPAERIGDALPLVNVTLELDDNTVALGNPTIHPVAPATRLFSPWVTYSDKLDSAAFLQQAQDEMRARNLSGQVSLTSPGKASSKDGGQGLQGPAVRRTRQIKGHSVVGYALLVTHLSAADSLQLCLHGLGGRRHFGGGLFLPERTR